MARNFPRPCEKTPSAGGGRDVSTEAIGIDAGDFTAGVALAPGVASTQRPATSPPPLNSSLNGSDTLRFSCAPYLTWMDSRYVTMLAMRARLYPSRPSNAWKMGPHTGIFSDPWAGVGSRSPVT